jgi:chorismate mutase
MKTIYISGKVTGLPIEEVRKRFKHYQLLIEQQGHNAINPVDLIERINETRRELNAANPGLGFKEITGYNAIMGFCLCEMCVHADEVHMLPGWQDSKGATLERDVANRLGIPVKHVVKYF